MHELRVLSPRLPYCTRLRLAAEHHIDAVGGWLCGHRCSWLAVWLWRACRMI